jgi:signal transduction histidine kinase
VLHEPPPDAGLLTADAARLYQVIANLVTNAIKFSPPGGRVTLTVQRQPSLVTLAVRDDGPGIAVEEMPRLFQPFGRLSPKPTGRETSHGLGLSIAHEIVRLHGGTIKVESQPGEGATFTIELPLSQPLGATAT